MTETAAKELEKQELRHNSDQSTGTPIDIPPVEPTAPPIEINTDPAEDEIDRIVREQQALLDARLQKESDEKAEADIAAHEAEEKAKAETQGVFTFTAFIQFKHYVKVTADTEEEALDKIGELKLGDYINKKDVRFDKQKTN